jgi:hypothetical protein
MIIIIVSLLQVFNHAGMHLSGAIKFLRRTCFWRVPGVLAQKLITDDTAGSSNK